MTLYRIKPHKAKSWKVQVKFGPFWLTVSRYFADEERAEGFIRDALADEAEEANNKRLARERKRTIAPRIYP